MFDPNGFVIDGKALALGIRAALKVEIEKLLPSAPRPPGLVTILVGDDAGSQVYVRNKQAVAKEIGAKIFSEVLPKELSSDQLLSVIDRYNNHPEVDGILLQLPLPSPLERNRFLRAISPDKDVDGLHPISQGLIMRGEAGSRPCTPLGILMLIDHALEKLKGERRLHSPYPTPHDLSGFKVVIIGRSIIVGQPAGAMLLERNATVVLTHSKTQNISREIRDADIVVAACGKPELVKGEWIKPGAIVIDVGISRQSNGKLIGDVEFEATKIRAGAITPVPGGVGPMTIAMLMKNTVDAWKRSLI
jgi:methylenetetrahydrofolate dehydrogenase (NADP+)/methenyltetrahydrofolate cyclohydrolase